MSDGTTFQSGTADTKRAGGHGLDIPQICVIAGISLLGFVVMVVVLRWYSMADDEDSDSEADGGERRRWRRTSASRTEASVDDAAGTPMSARTPLYPRAVYMPPPEMDYVPAYPGPPLPRLSPLPEEVEPSPVSGGVQSGTRSRSA